MCIDILILTASICCQYVYGNVSGELQWPVITIQLSAVIIKSHYNSGDTNMLHA